ncbi:hypothetical protein BaRGS_00020955 [Batillaria attramentaria]|uniref:Uncharacterized protein n=1 Tax=Batillaria attramentaria TaxID=370345 RepID=A0ABD0KKW8_9CAEN
MHFKITNSLPHPFFDDDGFWPRLCSATVSRSMIKKLFSLDRKQEHVGLHNLPTHTLANQPTQQAGRQEKRKAKPNIHQALSPACPPPTLDNLKSKRSSLRLLPPVRNQTLGSNPQDSGRKVARVVDAGLVRVCFSHYWDLTFPQLVFAEVQTGGRSSQPLDDQSDRKSMAGGQHLKRRLSYM